MFTGIIQAKGCVEALEPIGGDLRLRLSTGELDMGAVGIGDSIAVNGVCLTAALLADNGFSADVSQETLSLTTLGDLSVGSPVNLEPSLCLSSPLGGHLVSGHIDGTGVVVSLSSDARSTRMMFEVPAGLERYLARKGSVAIDGTSLTINEVAGRQIGVNIVPHTLERTIMSNYAVGTRVNIEVDLVARYLERLMSTEN